MKITEYIRKNGKYYPDKPFDPYNCYPYASIRDVRDSYGDFVTSTEGYSYFIVWIDLVPGNKPKVELFFDKEDVDRYRSDYDCHPSQWSKDWLHYCEGTTILPINGRSAEELNNYIAKILLDFYNKSILEYIEKNKPKTSQELPNHQKDTPANHQASHDSPNTHTDSSEKKKTSSTTYTKSRAERTMECLRKHHFFDEIRHDL